MLANAIILAVWFLSVYNIAYFLVFFLEFPNLKFKYPRLELFDILVRFFTVIILWYLVLNR
jgi:hypothetical protein